MNAKEYQEKVEEMIDSINLNGNQSEVVKKLKIILKEIVKRQEELEDRVNRQTAAITDTRKACSIKDPEFW